MDTKVRTLETSIIRDGRGTGDGWASRLLGSSKTSHPVFDDLGTRIYIKSFKVSNARMKEYQLWARKKTKLEPEPCAFLKNFTRFWSFEPRRLINSFHRLKKRVVTDIESSPSV